MSEELNCTCQCARAESWCLYHETPLCVTCKFENTHKACPKKTVSTMVNFPITDSRRDLYEECKKIYSSVLEMEKNISIFTEKKPRLVTESLEAIFRNFRDQLKSLQDETVNCVSETESECIRNCNEFKSIANKLLNGIGEIMKDLCEDTLDVGRTEEQVNGYKNVANTKLKGLDKCDIEYRIGLKIARLLDPENIQTLRRAILESTLVESLFPVTITNSGIQFIRNFDAANPYTSEKTPVISGCTVLYTGTIVLIDKANSSIKFFSENGVFQNDIKTDSRPDDIACAELGIWVSFPRLLVSHVRFYLDVGSRFKDTSMKIDVKNGKCFGVEYGGEKLVVSCKISWCKIFGSPRWRFCVFGKDGTLLQIVEKDKLGKSFYMSDGYFNFCPYRDQILFLSASGKAKQFQMTGPSSLEHLSLLDFKKSQRYKMSTLVSSGGAIITCHKKYKLSLTCTYKTVIHLIGSGKSRKTSVIFHGENPGPMCCDVRSRTIIVCEQPSIFTDRGKTVYVYKF